MQIPRSGTGQKVRLFTNHRSGDGVVTTPFSNSPHLIGEKLSRSGNDLRLSRRGPGPCLIMQPNPVSNRN